MTSKVRLLPEAILDVEEITEYYKEIRPALGKQFQLKVADRLKSLRKFSNYQIAYDNRVRVYRLQVFGYFIHFVINPETEIVEVQAVQHVRRQKGL